MSEWRRRHAVIRRERQIVRAIDAVSPDTLQNEARAFAQAQINR